MKFLIEKFDDKEQDTKLDYALKHLRMYQGTYIDGVLYQKIYGFYGAPTLVEIEPEEKAIVKDIVNLFESKNPLKDAQKAHRKRSKGLSPFSYLNPNGGDVEKGIETFNKNMTPNVSTTSTQSTTSSGESMGESVDVSKQTATFKYAVIEFVEGGPRSDTPTEMKIRKLVKDQTQFTDLDKLGDILHQADIEVSERNGTIGYDKCYVDFYGEVDGKVIKYHGYRIDLGDGISRKDIVSNDDIPEIENLLTKNAYKTK